MLQKNHSSSCLRSVNQILTTYTKKGQLTKLFCTRLAVSSWGTFGANVTNKYVPATASVPPLKKKERYFGNTHNHGHLSQDHLEIASRRKLESI